MFAVVHFDAVCSTGCLYGATLRVGARAAAAQHRRFVARAPCHGSNQQVMFSAMDLTGDGLQTDYNTKCLFLDQGVPG